MKNAKKLESGDQSESTRKKYMCLDPYAGIVCKRDGKHAGVAMANFETCYAILVVTNKSLLALHYPSRVYSKQLPYDLKKWQALFAEKIEQALIVANKKYSSLYPSGDPGEENNITRFQARLSKDIGLEFTVSEIAGLVPNDNLLIVGVDAKMNLCRNNFKTNPENYANWPRQPSPRLRYYHSRAQFYTQNDNFSVTIVGSKNFLAPIEEKAWPFLVNNHVTLLRQQKPKAIQTIGQELIEASTDKNNQIYAWAMAIGLLKGVDDVPNNLKHYLFLLLSLLNLLDKTIKLPPLTKQVEDIDKTLGMR